MLVDALKVPHSQKYVSLNKSASEDYRMLCYCVLLTTWALFSATMFLFYNCPLHPLQDSLWVVLVYLLRYFWYFLFRLWSFTYYPLQTLLFLFHCIGCQLSLRSGYRLHQAPCTAFHRCKEAVCPPIVSWNNGVGCIHWVIRPLSL